MTLTLQQLSDLVSGEILRGGADTELHGLNSIREAGPGEITFLGNPRYLPQLKSTQASAALIPMDYVLSEDTPSGLALVRCENPTLAFSSVIRHFGPPAREFAPGVHPSASVAASAVFDPQKVSIGPCVVIEEGVRIGDGTILRGGVFIGHEAILGENCLLHANSTVRERCVLGNRVILQNNCVIGSDGFGYELVKGRHQKIEQVGIVQLDDDVEVGSCTTIDRARFGRTWIGEGTKIDNLVQIAHNVIIGPHSIVVSQTGISGSTRIGNHVTIAGQVGIAGHLEIADQVMLLAKSGVSKSITEPGAYTGFPARPLIEGRKMLALPAKIPDLIDRVRDLERKIADLEQKQG